MVEPSACGIAADSSGRGAPRPFVATWTAALLALVVATAPAAGGMTLEIEVTSQGQPVFAAGPLELPLISGGGTVFVFSASDLPQLGGQDDFTLSGTVAVNDSIYEGGLRVSPDLAFLNTSGAGLEMMLRLTWPAAHNGGVNWNSAAAWNLVNAGTLFTLPGTSLWTVRVDEAVIGTLFEDPSGLSGGGNATLTSAPISGEHDPFGEAMIVDLAFSLTPGTSAEVNGSMLLTPCLSCAGDADCDGIVDISDVLALLAAWGTDDPLFDLAPEGGDGQVDVIDLLALLASWGPCP